MFFKPGTSDGRLFGNLFVLINFFSSGARKLDFTVYKSLSFSPLDL